MHVFNYNTTDMQFFGQCILTADHQEAPHATDFEGDEEQSGNMTLRKQGAKVHLRRQS